MRHTSKKPRKLRHGGDFRANTWKIGPGDRTQNCEQCEHFANRSPGDRREIPAADKIKAATDQDRRPSVIRGPAAFFYFISQYHIYQQRIQVINRLPHYAIGRTPPQSYLYGL